MYSYPMQIVLEQIYLIHRLDPNSYKSGSGHNGSEVVTLYYSELRNWCFTNGRCFESYQGHSCNEYSLCILRLFATCVNKGLTTPGIQERIGNITQKKDWINDNTAQDHQKETIKRIWR